MANLVKYGVVTSSASSQFNSFENSNMLMFYNMKEGNVAEPEEKKLVHIWKLKIHSEVGTIETILISRVDYSNIIHF